MPYIEEAHIGVQDLDGVLAGAVCAGLHLILKHSLSLWLSFNCFHSCKIENTHLDLYLSLKIVLLQIRVYVLTLQ